MEKELQQAVAFHDPRDKSWMMKEAVQFDPTKKSPENRKYLVLAQCIDEDNNFYIIAEGRTECYNMIKQRIDEIDVANSYVFLEGNPLVFEDLPGQKKLVSVLAFLRHILDEELVEDDTAYIVEEVLAEMEGED